MQSTNKLITRATEVTIAANAEVIRTRGRWISLFLLQGEVE